MSKLPDEGRREQMIEAMHKPGDQLPGAMTQRVTETRETWARPDDILEHIIRRQYEVHKKRMHNQKAELAMLDRIMWTGIAALASLALWILLK